MRRISYMMKLLDGYTITNGDAHDYDYLGRKNAPDTNIRMMVEWPEETCGNVLDFFKIEGDCAAPPNPEFERLLPQIIRGEKTAWRLCGVHVHSCGIYIDFVNDALQTQKEGLYAQYKFREADAILSTVAMEMTLPEVIEGDIDMVMRFEVPLPDGSGVSTTLVRTNGHDLIAVTELNVNSQRVITFSEAVEDESNPHEAYSDLVEVTEYSW